MTRSTSVEIRREREISREISRERERNYNEIYFSGDKQREREKLQRDLLQWR